MYLISIIAVLPFYFFCQSDSTRLQSGPDEIIELCDYSAEAQFRGGYAALQQFISQNIGYSECLNETADSKIYLSFGVQKNGTISELKILKGGCTEQNEDFLELIRKMPLWIPAKDVNGNPIASNIYLPIIICLN